LLAGVRSVPDSICLHWAGRQGDGGYQRGDVRRPRGAARSPRTLGAGDAVRPSVRIRDLLRPGAEILTRWAGLKETPGVSCQPTRMSANRTVASHSSGREQWLIAQRTTSNLTFS